MKRIIVELAGAALWALVCLVLVTPAHSQVPIYTRPQAGITAGGIVTSSQILAPDGSQNVPAYSFTSTSNTGWLLSSSNLMLSIAGSGRLTMGSSGGAGVVQFASSGGVFDSSLVSDGANTLALKNGTNAQEFRVYGNTTGPKYLSLKHDGTNAVEDNHGFINLCTNVCSTILLGSTAKAAGMQLRTSQQTVPTITTNGGTGPACVGSDTAMGCTIGTAPPAAATFTVTFNGTWASAPSCVAVRGTTGTTPVVTSVATTTTTAVVTLSANLVASERYNILCMGVS